MSLWRAGSLPWIEAGLVGTCGIIELEIRYSARSQAEYGEIRRDRTLGYECFPMPDYDLTSSVTGQNTEWVVPMGSLR